MNDNVGDGDHPEPKTNPEHGARTEHAAAPSEALTEEQADRTETPNQHDCNQDVGNDPKIACEGEQNQSRGAACGEKQVGDASEHRCLTIQLRHPAPVAQTSPTPQGQN